MNIADIVIIVFLLVGGATGFGNGFFKQSVIFVGTIFVFIISWFLKDFIAAFLSFTMTFLKFNGLSALNIVFYQSISFLIILAVLIAVLVVLIKITGIFEKVLKFTIVLGIPSKILGFFVGLLESYVILFVVLFFLNQPALGIHITNDSELSPFIINSSPILSDVVGDMNESVKDIYRITKDYEDSGNEKETNKKIIDSLLKHKVIDQKYLDKLEKKGKISY